MPDPIEKEEPPKFIFLLQEEWKEIVQRLAALETEQEKVKKRLDALDVIAKLHDDIVLLVCAIQGISDAMVKNSL